MEKKEDHKKESQNLMNQKYSEKEIKKMARDIWAQGGEAFKKLSKE